MFNIIRRISLVVYIILTVVSDCNTSWIIRGQSSAAINDGAVVNFVILSV